MELGSIVWRKKMALEQGSGFDQISNKFGGLIDDEEYAKESKIVALDKVIVRDNEHLYYYRIYKSFFGCPIKETCNSPRCSFCSACLTASNIAIHAELFRLSEFLLFTLHQTVNV